MKLSVIKEFAEHAVGDVITDAKAVAAVLRSEFAHFVVKAPVEEPEAQAAPEPHD